MMRFDEIMDDLCVAIAAAVDAADNEDGAPYDALRKIQDDIYCLADTNMTRAEFDDMKALYEGARVAGLVGKP